MVDVWNCTLTGIAETALENSEVSPVEVLVAVAVTQVFAGRLLDGVNEMAAFPWPVGEELLEVVTVVDPIGVCPWPKPEGSGTRLVKNWIRNDMPGRLFRVPWIELDVPPPTAVVRTG